MLPDRSELRDIFSFLREIQVADKVLITFSMRDSSADPDALIAAADRYAAGLDSALATPMSTRFRTDEIAQDFVRLARQLPDYTEEADFARLETDTSAAGIRGSLEALRRRVQQPAADGGEAWECRRPCCRLDVLVQSRSMLVPKPP